MYFLLKKFIFLYAVIFISTGLILFGGISIIHAQSSSSTVSNTTSTTLSTDSQGSTSAQEERAKLEAQLAKLELQQEEYQKTIDEYQKQGGTLKNEIAVLNAKIAKIKVQTSALNLTLVKIGNQINDTQGQINRTENKIDTNKNAIASSMQKLYEADRESLLAIMMSHSTLSDFFGNVANFILVQHNVQIALDEIIKLRQGLIEQKQQLDSEKTDAENLRLIQLAQQRSAQNVQAQKNNILTRTKGKESEYQKLLQKTKESAAQIRNRIFELLGGGELTFEKAYQYARVAESATGVRTALTLSILDRESLLGKNVGQCNYQTAMHPTRDIPYFLELLGKLGIDPNSDAAKVSCANQHGAYGGAMGPAQFIPSTWKLYADKITAVTGNNPANPWNNSDAFAATAIYIKDLLSSSSCRNYAEANKHIVSYQTLLERCAAAKYYAGGNWYTYRFWYGDPVVQHANKFEDDIAILNKE